MMEIVVQASRLPAARARGVQAKRMQARGPHHNADSATAGGQQ